MPYLDIPHGVLYYEDDGAGPPIVFIHGLAGDARLWESQPAFLGDNFRVIRYDLRGHGRSTMPTDAPYTHTGDLAALLDHLGIERATIVGQSMGGEIAVSFALNFPERVTSLVLVDPALNGHQWSPEWNGSWGEVVDACVSGDREAIVTSILAHPVLEVSIKSPEVKAKLAEIFAGYTGWHFANADPLVQDAVPATQRLGEVTAPVLLVTGDSTIPDFLRIADTLNAGISNIRRVDLPGVGHVSPLEAPDTFNALVADFLASRES